MRLPASALALSALFWSSSVHAERLIALTGDAGLGSVGSTPHAAFALGFDIREGALAFGLAGRVRLALTDGDSGVLRSRDYDEVSDYLHILRYFDYRRQLGSVSLYLGAGELRGDTLGHGSLLRDYSNIADPDHLKAGFKLHLEHEVFELSLLLDNLAQPALVGGRLALRPFPKLRRLSVAASGALDIRAAGAARLGPAGAPAIDEGSWTLDVEREVLGLAALDLEIAFAKGGKQIKPYLDLATTFRGVGLHVGASGQLPLGSSGKVVLSAQLEYRLSSGGYAPGYFGTFYDLERYQAALAFSDGRRAPAGRIGKLEALEAGLFGGHGVLAQLALDVGRLLSAKVGYRYHPGPDGSQLWVRVVSEPIARLTFGALAVIRALGQESQAADGLATLAEARFRITPYLYTVAQFARSWALLGDTRGYAPLLRFNVGVGGSWSR
ncbi:MAG: hypothetical protein CSA65_04415 [Proteobacteria bacterium]|nr:MAG: hypothetical protein CSA65_04415 [Pseudomonadota bacterium]